MRPSMAGSGPSERISVVIVVMVVMVVMVVIVAIAGKPNPGLPDHLAPFADQNMGPGSVIDAARGGGTAMGTHDPVEYFRRR